MASRKHLVAVNRMIRSVGLDETGRDAAVVELARDLARLLDAAGAAAPINLIRGYQSAVKDLERAAARVDDGRILPRINPEEPSSEADDDVAESAPNVTSIDDWRPAQLDGIG